MDDIGDLLPRPDPTKLTTDQIHREIAAVRELLESKLDQLGTEMYGHWTLDIERFESVHHRLVQVESIRIEQKADTTKSIEAALLSVRQENARIEQSTTRQVDAERATSRAEWEGLDSIVSDLKDQLSVMRSVRQGGNESRAALYTVIGVIMAVLSSVAIIVTLATKL